MAEKPSAYRVVFVEPGQPACEKEIGTDLSDLQEAVRASTDSVGALSDL